MQRYQDLKVWQRSHALIARMLYALRIRVERGDR
jgi:hypothetical protein